MDMSWLSPALTGVGLIFTFIVNRVDKAKASGILQESVSNHGKTLESHDRRITSVEVTSAEHGAEIGVIQGKLDGKRHVRPNGAY